MAWRRFSAHCRPLGPLELQQNASLMFIFCEYIFATRPVQEWFDILGLGEWSIRNSKQPFILNGWIVGFPEHSIEFLSVNSYGNGTNILKANDGDKNGSTTIVLLANDRGYIVPLVLQVGISKTDVLRKTSLIIWQIFEYSAYPPDAWWPRNSKEVMRRFFDPDQWYSVVFTHASEHS